MEIVVCISVVPDTTSKISFTENGTKFDKNGITYIINPFDEFCLTKAIFIKENLGANITILNVGKNENDTVLRKALAIGADKAIRIDTESIDGGSVAKSLANYIKSQNYDIIFCGKESIDYNGGKVPGFISAIINKPFINGAVGMEIEGNKVIVKNEIDNGIQVCEVLMPVVIAGQKGLVEEKELRIPSMRGIMMARNKPLEIISEKENFQEDLNSVKFELPEKKSECKILEPENVSELINLLRNEAKIL